MVCDIIANGALLPDEARYAISPDDEKDWLIREQETQIAVMREAFGEVHRVFGGSIPRTLQKEIEAALTPGTGNRARVVDGRVLRPIGDEPKNGDLFLGYREDAGFFLCGWRDDVLFTAWGEDLTGDHPTLWANSPIEAELRVVDVEFLKSLQWWYGQKCPTCGGMKPYNHPPGEDEGHHPDCWLAALIGEGE